MRFQTKSSTPAVSTRNPKKRIHTLLIFLGTSIFIVLIIFSSVKIYQIALAETRRNHQFLQREMAVVSVSGIRDYLNHLTEDLRLLTISPCMQRQEKMQYQSFLANFFDVHKRSNLRAIFLTDSSFNIVYSLPDSISKYIPKLTKADIQPLKMPAWYSAVFPGQKPDGQQELCYLVITSVPTDLSVFSGSNDQKPAIAYIGIVASFDWLIQHYVSPLNIGTTVTAWLMDKRGRLLYHPRHPEMVLRSIAENSPDCIECHASFDWQRRMISSPAAFGEYTVGKEPTKIMSHVPLDVQNERWILVISSNLSDVTSVLRSKFSLFFIIVLIILALVLLIAIYLYRINVKRIRAEEAQRLSEQKELLHLQACQASKLASVGELVDTVAHEINTPVSIIVAQTQAIDLKRAGAANDYSEELQIIKEQTQRISKYTHRLLKYSHNMPFNPRPGNLKTLMDECLYLLGHRFRAYNIKIHKYYAQNLPLPTVDQSQMEQVFINLLNNAVDAIHANGEITISMESARRDNGQSGIEIRIADNGEGISEEVLPQIFNPFFTTKKPSKGTGLGLSISRAILQRHGGKITVTSKPGKGATFTIFLPVKNIA